MVKHAHRNQCGCPNQFVSSDNCRNISITLKIPEKANEKRTLVNMAWLHQLRLQNVAFGSRLPAGQREAQFMRSRFAAFGRSSEEAGKGGLTFTSEYVASR